MYRSAIVRVANVSLAPRSAPLMKTFVSTVGLIAAATALIALPANAAPRQKCQAGTFWSKAKGQCVEAGSQVKQKPSCITFTADGGIGSVPCAS